MYQTTAVADFQHISGGGVAIPKFKTAEFPSTLLWETYDNIKVDFDLKLTFVSGIQIDSNPLFVMQNQNQLKRLSDTKYKNKTLIGIK